MRLKDVKVGMKVRFVRNINKPGGLPKDGPMSWKRFIGRVFKVTSIHPNDGTPWPIETDFTNKKGEKAGMLSFSPGEVELATKGKAVAKKKARKSSPKRR